MNLTPRGLGPKLSEFTRDEERNIFVRLKNGCMSDWDDWIANRMFRYVEGFEYATYIITNNVNNITWKIREMEEYNDKALDDAFYELKSELGYEEDTD